MIPDDFAAEWESAWNAHDLDRIMRHYHPDIRFRSEKAVALTGSGDISGADALRAYWAKALDQQADLEFQVIDVFHGHEMLVLTYRNHHGVLAAEPLYFDETGLAYQGAACHRKGH